MVNASDKLQYIITYLSRNPYGTLMGYLSMMGRFPTHTEDSDRASKVVSEYSVFVNNCIAGCLDPSERSELIRLSKYIAI